MGRSHLRNYLKDLCYISIVDLDVKFSGSYFCPYMPILVPLWFESLTFISQLMHSIVQNVDVKIYVV